MIKVRFFFLVMISLSLSLVGCGNGGSSVPPTVQQFSGQVSNLSLAWHNVAWQIIRQTNMAPTTQARAMMILHTSIYNAWAAYDPVAVGTRLGSTLRRPLSEATLANKNEAISYAAYHALLDLFPTQSAILTAEMKSLGYSILDTSTDRTKPDGIGNVASAADIAYYHNDGSNQLNGYADTTGYQPKNPQPLQHS